MRGGVRPKAVAGVTAELASLILTTLGTLSDNDIWWPAPELADTIGFSLINPVNNTTFFTSAAEGTYWNCKWMVHARYSQSHSDHSRPLRGPPPWFPGNSPHT